MLMMGQDAFLADWAVNLTNLRNITKLLFLSVTWSKVL